MNELLDLQIDHNAAIPLHVQVESLLRRLMSRKEYRDGQFLPKEEELARRLGISRNTVRQAIMRLVHEGLLIRKKGIGTRIADSRFSTRLDAWASFTHEMNEKGIPFETMKQTVSWTTVNGDVAKALQIPPRTRVLQLERLKGIKGEPIIDFVSIFHPRIGLRDTDDFSLPLYELLERHHAVVAKYSAEEISAMTATAEQAKCLHVKKGSPILVRKRLVSDPGRRPIEYNLCYYRADRFTYTIEIQRV